MGIDPQTRTSVPVSGQRRAQEWSLVPTRRPLHRLDAPVVGTFTVRGIAHPVMSDVIVRQARRDDHEAVAAFTQQTWSDRGVEDYIPDAFPEWVETDGDDQRTFVAELDGSVCGVCQGVMLSPDEGWAQALRVDPEFRGREISPSLTAAVHEWCREQGATVVRNLVFAWNGAGLGQSRATGFEPATELRFASPEPDPDADPTDHGPDDAVAVGDPAAAWRYWTGSAAREYLGGLAADDDETWAVRELTRTDLDRAAEDDGAIAVQTDDGTVAMAVRSRIDRRTVEAEGDGTKEEGEGEEESGAEETVAVYGATAWEDLDACAALVSAIAADAAAVGADDTRVLVPETARRVSDLAACRVEIGDEPDFVLAADVTARE
jgi:GNAT superfamily N-acetyltransferase